MLSSSIGNTINIERWTQCLIFHTQSSVRHVCSIEDFLTSQSTENHFQINLCYDFRIEEVDRWVKSIWKALRLKKKGVCDCYFLVNEIVGTLENSYQSGKSWNFLPVRNTSWSPKFNASHFGLPPSSIYATEWLGWVVISHEPRCIPTGPIAKSLCCWVDPFRNDAYTIIM